MGRVQQVIGRLAGDGPPSAGDVRRRSLKFKMAHRPGQGRDRGSVQAISHALRDAGRIVSATGSIPVPGRKQAGQAASTERRGTHAQVSIARSGRVPMH
ncbi:uncharacterized protein SCHCODRAFT_01245750 [Schizophyllum commune H4-8]|uniref:uncharacterized protein n=1 Tax=Schizophyllum commune (strain H4-8 / FGSC 9210) TaxID=578458 RepID=UPI0021609576|nr:uncharacterized protein SCHCODRAFT_01245750 [Schizophyllum commune H4-8]KAI5887149.1 hypothetical protein SCHCODRAFT_01245750 [Schizophyllum commune H4-8]